MQVSNGIARMAKRLPCLVALAVVVMMAPAARATTCTLDTPNAQLSNVAGPYATATFTTSGSTTSGTLNITLQALDSFKVGDVFGFNVDPACGITSLSLSTVTGDSVSQPVGTTGNVWKLGTNVQVDGFGKFDFAVSGPASGRFSTLVFTLNYTGTNVTGADCFDFLKNGVSAAAHIFPPGGTNTGFAACVPEPSSMALLGMGLTMGLGALYRRRRSPAV